MAGAVIAAGRGSVQPCDVATALITGSSEHMKPRWVTAPAHGLTLARVHYSDSDALVVAADEG